MTHPDPAEAYVRLAHAIDAHEEGFVDGYGGPPGWADRTPTPPAELRERARRLLDDVQAVEPSERRAFLEAQVRAMLVTLDRLCGESRPYRDEVRGLFDIEPVGMTQEELDAALARVEAHLPGSGPLPARLEALRERVVVPRERILDLAQPILAELRARTRARLGLPDGEEFTIGLVNDRPWSGYNWPLGNLKSRIDINTDLPVLLTNLPDLMAHEGYPGHHTEHASKEARLVRDLGWREHSLQLLNTPECAVSEGIAMNALGAVMTGDEVRGWLTGDLAAQAGLDAAEVGAYLDAARAVEHLRAVNASAALMLHAEGRPEAEVLDFLQTYNLLTPERARQSLRFISNPTFRAYTFTYSAGQELVGDFLEVGGDGAFRRLLSEPLTPGRLHAEVAAGEDRARR
ncbi:hypothetical protein HNQ07_002836 [Deinococcus metalli]|uniref:DUF885 domain-containing protein n=1 Tax=Deinococcus metalli TaxID=1141878 RepID=A0A7W8NNW1_9DEIO|nr:hypothetical protein [Deinococcus metalli]MBB5377344.1 hypothetical protein [Deinococcus metalli]GHF49770.1 hypothetical protein GCM10017781_27710 [Deinococcus metalli]